MRGKIRNPNIEIRNKFQKREGRKRGRVGRIRFSTFPILRICFGLPHAPSASRFARLRISIFGFSQTREIEELTGAAAAGIG